MLSGLVAAVPASQHSCRLPEVSLNLGELGLLARHLCDGCRKPFALTPFDDYFSAFAVRRTFQQNLEELEKNFYLLSKALHPDRFVASGPEAKALSLKRMSFVNQAYFVLKNPDERRQYLLELEGVKSPSAMPGSIPTELAENWFEIQEQAADLELQLQVTDPSPMVTLQKRLDEFQNSLEQMKQASETSLMRLENAYDSGLNIEPKTTLRSILDQMAVEIQRRSYLQSLAQAFNQMKQKMKVA
jgi:molecular chaperone HscB